MSGSKETLGNISVGGDISKDVNTGDNNVPSEIDWMNANADMLAKEYAGKWIAVSEDVLVASGETEARVLGNVTELGINDFLLVRIPSPDDPQIQMFTATVAK